MSGACVAEVARLRRRVSKARILVNSATNSNRGPLSARAWARDTMTAVRDPIGAVMAAKRPFANPFYALLLVVGVAFLLTATSYGVLAFRDVQGQSTTGSGSGLMQFLDRHGALLMA